MSGGTLRLCTHTCPHTSPGKVLTLSLGANPHCSHLSSVHFWGLQGWVSPTFFHSSGSQTLAVPVVLRRWWQCPGQVSRLSSSLPSPPLPKTLFISKKLVLCLHHRAGATGGRETLYWGRAQHCFHRRTRWGLEQALGVSPQVGCSEAPVT